MSHDDLSDVERAEWVRGHGVHLVPVSISDGIPLIPCPSLDGEGWDAIQIDFWAGWCSTCRTVVGDPVPGTEGVADLDGLADDIWENVVRPAEVRVNWEHTMDLVVASASVISPEGSTV